MDILGIMGSTPGLVVATVSHGNEIRTLRLRVLRHPGGGWHVQRPGGALGPRCHSVPAAILLEAGDVFAGQPMSAAA